MKSRHRWPDGTTALASIKGPSSERAAMPQMRRKRTLQRSEGWRGLLPRVSLRRSLWSAGTEVGDAQRGQWDLALQMQSSFELSSLLMPKMVEAALQIYSLEDGWRKWPISRSNPTASSATCTRSRWW